MKIKKIFIKLTVVALLILVCSNTFAGLTRVKSKKIHLTGFMIKESPDILRLDTGSTVYRLNSKSLMQKNPLIERDIASPRQTKVVLESKDVVGIDNGSGGKSSGERP